MQDLLLIPILANILLTFVVQQVMYQKRKKSVIANKVKVRDIANNDDLERLLPDARPASNNFKNQFELPVIFYALVAFSMILNLATWTDLVLASLFVVTRMAHAYIHCTSNRVKFRFLFYVCGTFILYAMLAHLAYRWALNLIY
ncbi:MAG: MAPEG family protein [Gammaproteobacteria bacterium]|nr:MAPEG family protein [Gammaproteobacteria bacterium]